MQFHPGLHFLALCSFHTTVDSRRQLDVNFSRIVESVFWQCFKIVSLGDSTHCCDAIRRRPFAVLLTVWQWRHSWPRAQPIECVVTTEFCGMCNFTRNHWKRDFFCKSDILRTFKAILRTSKSSRSSLLIVDFNQNFIYRAVETEVFLTVPAWQNQGPTQRLLTISISDEVCTMYKLIFVEQLHSKT